MPRLLFTANLRRYFDCAPVQVEGETVAAVLAAFFGRLPQARSYILDDQGALREHLVVFLDGEPIRDRTGQREAVRPESEIYVMQALSGG